MFRRRIILHLRKISNPNHRNYSKISPIAEAFNARPNAKFNFMRKTETGLFGIRELRTHKGFHVLQSQCLEKTNDLIREALSDARYRKMVEIFDELSDSLCQVADLADFIRLAHPSMEFRHAAEYSCVSLSKIVEQLNTHASLYGILKEAVLRGDVKPTTEVDQLVGQLFLFDFEQSGIHLGETEREQVCVLNDVILNLGQSFVAGTDKPRKVDKYDIPETVRNVFAADGNDLLVSGLYVDSNNPLTREIAYKLFLHPDENQDMILMDLLKARHELAQVCGFHTYSERALRGGTLDTPSQVMEFLDTLSRGIGNYAQADFKLMQHMKNLESPSSGPLAAWDVPYFSLKAKRDWFNVSQKEYSPYFSLGACMDGLNCLFQRLYGITLVNSEVNDGECWSPDVYKLAVVSDTEGTLGYIYCDFYERTGKQNQDCHFTIRGGRQLPNGDYQTPIVVLMLNFAMPRWGTPSLLTPQMVDNLFHEMGHAMHSMLARTQYQHVTGTRCSTDFAEVPSVLMEFFASDPRVLRMFARHFQTNEPIPEDKLQRLCASKRLFTASETQLQLFYAALDQMYHGRHPLPGTTSDVLNDAQTKYYGLPYVGNTNWQLRFSHLVGYGAKYYSYLVSRALAYWIWQTYFERDPFSRVEGEKYRRECLAHGGGKNPKKLVADFLMFEPTPEILATSLLKEIADDQDIIQSAACNIASTK